MRSLSIQKVESLNKELELENKRLSILVDVCLLRKEYLIQSRKTIQKSERLLKRWKTSNQKRLYSLNMLRYEAGDDEL